MIFVVDPTLNIPKKVEYFQFSSVASDRGAIHLFFRRVGNIQFGPIAWIEVTRPPSPEEVRGSLCCASKITLKCVLQNQVPIGYDYDGAFQSVLNIHQNSVLKQGDHTFSWLCLSKKVLTYVTESVAQTQLMSPKESSLVHQNCLDCKQKEIEGRS